MVPQYRADQCNHACLYGKVLTGSIVMPLAGASNKGRLWVCTTLVCPLLLLWYLVPVWDRFCFATTVAVDAFGRHGATQDLSQRGVCQSGQEGVMAVGRFCRNAVGPPEWECQAMDSVVWVVCYLCRVY